MATDNTHALAEQGAENYPETLRITVGDVDQMFGDAIEQLGDDSPADEAVRSFEQIGDIRALLTDRRVEVMRTIMNHDPVSISDLAEQLDRNYSDIHADVEVLANHHIVYFETEGQRKRPVIPYDRIRLDIEVAADVTDSRARA
jgi:predicted transcriptional regulator